MSDKKISQLTAASTPLAGSEVLPIVQSGVTKQVSVNNLTQGKFVSCDSFGAGTTSLLGGAKAESRQNADANYSTTFTTGTSKTQLVLRDLSDVDTYSTPFSTLIFAAGSTGAAWSTISNIRLSAQNSALAFATSQDSGNPVERVRIANTGDTTLTTGNLVIGTSGKGIDFSATPGTGTSELLADYEEGTWTPSLGGTATYTNRSGIYTKIGNIVYANCLVQVNLIGTGSDTTISGLPFVTTTRSLGSSSYFNTINTTVNFLTPFADGASSTIKFLGATLATPNPTDGISVFRDDAYVILSVAYTV
jgi:hypothetical protein